jgi:hypothetical protein
MKTHLKALIVGICGLGLSASIVQGDHGPTATAVAEVFHNKKGFYWSDTTSVSGCSLGGASLTLWPDGSASYGSASWRGVVSSIFSNDAYCVTLSFLNSGGHILFTWPRFCSQTLWQSEQVWTNNNLAYPLNHYRSIAAVTKRDHC